MGKKKTAEAVSLDTLHAAVLSMKGFVENIYEEMATQESLAETKTELQKGIVAAKKESAHHSLQNSEQLVFLTQRITAIEKTQEEVLGILRPMQRAQDSDSEAIVSHDHRLIRIERKLSLAK